MEIKKLRYSFKSSSQSSMSSWTETETAFEPMSPTHKEIDSPVSHDGDSSFVDGNASSFQDIRPDSHIQSSESLPIWSRCREYARDAFSEFFGTMILVLFGDGVVAQVLLSHGQKGDYQSISWGWGWVGLLLNIIIP